jgi:threonine dehydratase
MASNVGTSVTALLAAAGTGLRNYITDLIAVNTGAATAAVNLRDSDASIIARIIVPTGGGSNMLGLATPLRTGSLNSHVDMVPLTPSSIITITASGYIAP